MSAARTRTELPLVEAVRRPPRTLMDPPTWRVRCPYCRHAHLHAADTALTEMILPARCDGTKFYTVREAVR